MKHMVTNFKALRLTTTALFEPMKEPRQMVLYNATAKQQTAQIQNQTSICATNSKNKKTK